MARKIRRDTKLYKKSRVNKKVFNTFLFILLLVVLIGGGFVLSMGWQARVQKKDPSSDVATSDTQSKTASETSSTVTSGAETSSDTASPVTGTYESIFMPYTVYEGNNQTAIKQWLDKAKSDGYNTVAVELKDETGIIHYKSTNQMAIEYGAVSKDAIDLSPLVSSIKSAGLIPHASISALKDKTAPSIARGNSYAYGENTEVNWWDNSAASGGKPWLNPYMANTRQYIADLSKEVATAGFQQVVLINVMFPDKNTEKMNVITESMSREDILKQVVLDAQGQSEIPVVFGFTPIFSETVKAEIATILGLYEGKIPFVKAAELEKFKPIFTQLEIDDYVVY